MLQVLVGYVNDLDIPIGWLVITGDARFFATTKRLHNQIHGDLAGGPLDAGEAHHYMRMLTANAVELLGKIRPGDVALLHDPQTASLTEPLTRAAARVDAAARRHRRERGHGQRTAAARYGNRAKEPG
jgi:trehalose synthase